MEDISRPRIEGGWGLLNLRSFGKALICKSLLFIGEFLEMARGAGSLTGNI